MEEDSLKEMIKGFRECKTAAEERKFVKREKGNIRNNIKDWGLVEKSDAILKLIWINMMGHETEFAQVECMNALFYDDFKIKRIAYLGLTLFLSEKSEVLMMGTNRLRLDLIEHSNPYVVALGLKTFADITDKNMTIDLFQYINELLESDSKYLKKKAMLACVRVLQKQPNLVSELKELLPFILNEKNHGLLLCSLHLAKEVIKIKPEFRELFKNSLTSLYEVLDDLLRSDNKNYLIENLNDPILQINILQFLKEIAIHDETVAGDLGNNILKVYNCIKNESSAPAYSVLYECVRCIMQINSSHALKKIGIAILGRFLEMHHSNFLYLSLRMLYYVSSRYRDEVAKYDNMIRKCVRSGEKSIRKLAIQILRNIVSAENIDEIFDLILKELKREKDDKQIKELFSILLSILEKQPLSLLWFETKIIDLLSAVHCSIHEQDLFNFFDILSNYPQLQTFLLYKSVVLLGKRSSRSKETLIKTVSWIIGEFGELLEAKTEPQTNSPLETLKASKILEFFKILDFKKFSNITNHYIIISLSKLCAKISDKQTRLLVDEIFDRIEQTKYPSVILKVHQFRSLLRLDEEILEEILESVPPCSVNEIFKDLEIGGADFEDLNKKAREFNQKELDLVQSEDEQIIGGFREEVDLLEVRASALEEKSPENDQNLLDLDNPKENGQKQQDLLNFLDMDDIEPQNNGNKEGTEENPVDIDLFAIDLKPTKTEEKSKNTATEYDMLNLDQIQEENPMKLTDLKIDQNPVDLDQPKSLNPPIEKPTRNPYDFLDNPNQIGINEEDKFEEDEDFVETDNGENDAMKLVIYEGAVITLKYSSKKLSEFQNSVKLFFKNNSNSTISDLTLKIAVKKQFKILSNYLSRNSLKSYSDCEVFQDLILQNTSQQVKLALKIKMSYSLEGELQSENFVLKNISLL